MKPTKQAKPVKGWMMIHPDYSDGAAYSPIYHHRELAYRVLKTWRPLLKGPAPKMVRVEIRVVGGKK